MKMNEKSIEKQEELDKMEDGCLLPDDVKREENRQKASNSDISAIESVKSELDNKARQCEEYFCMLQRTAAEFDNFKKRTAREKETLYFDAVSDVVLAFLPVFDNMERAFCASSKDECPQSLKDGIELVAKQMKGILKNFGIEEIIAVGQEFDPQLHNAVIHVEDDSCRHNLVIEEFQKGYILKDKVIRHSMVKVAN
jgi:molecular chaperone GrpE